MRVLDLFCGLGGWSKGFAAEGFDVIGIDIVNVGYPYDFIQADIKEFHIDEKFDVVVGSPPCRNFSSISNIAHRPNYHKGAWKEPPNPVAGLEIVFHFLRIVAENKPKIWLMENVPGLEKWIGKAKVKTKLKPPMMWRCFWGDFPIFFIKMKYIESKDIVLVQNQKPHAIRSWKTLKYLFQSQMNSQKDAKRS